MICARGKLRRSDDNAGRAMTISPSELGLTSRMFSYTSDIGTGFYAMIHSKAIRIHSCPRMQAAYNGGRAPAAQKGVHPGGGKR